MKFWQKIFMGTLVIFILAFDIGVYILTTYSYNFNRQREMESGIREQSVILSSVTNRIANAEKIYSDAPGNKKRLKAVLKQLIDYYKPQGVLLALYDNDTVVYSDIAKMNKKLLYLSSTDNKNTVDGISGGKRYIFVSSQLPDYSHLTLIYARDISKLDEFRKNVSRIFVIVSAAILLFMGAAVYLLLRHLTRPIAKLNQITSEIADGAYDKRVELNRSDELGHLGDNFNRMADSVEENIVSLVKASEDRQQFIDDLTHEMKTPLTSILGYTEFLQNAKDNGEKRETAVAYLHEAAVRLKNLSGKLLELTYLRGEELVLQAVNIPDLFNDLAKMTPPVFNAKHLVLDTQTEITEIKGDETLILSIITNLVENAAKASEPNGRIAVRAYQMNEPIIEVTDTGHGMEQSDIEKITDPFYRVDKSRSRKFGGVGLGLSIVAQIVELHGARLEIESLPGIGTTVRIYFLATP